MFSKVFGLSLSRLHQVPGPLIWAPLSEEYGRKISILGPVFVFACFTAGTAVAKDVQVRDWYSFVDTSAEQLL